MTTSRLLIQRATKEDSGLYTCSPSNTLPYSARVHIVNGKGKRRSSFLVTLRRRFKRETIGLFAYESSGLLHYHAASEH